MITMNDAMTKSRIVANYLHVYLCAIVYLFSVKFQMLFSFLFSVLLLVFGVLCD